MHRILFVDDEPRILTGLRRMLRGQRRDWDMEFAEGGVEALTILQSRPFDVVVSDARMPGMEGSELLEQVRQRHPDTVRLILSGQCSRESTLLCAGVAHQFLNKPCDAESLIAAIHRVCLLRDQMPDPITRAAVSQIASLPSQAPIYAKFLEYLEADTLSQPILLELVHADIAMSAKLIHLVSSGFFGTPQNVDNVDQAVELLGLEMIRLLASVPGVFRPRRPGEIQEDFLRWVNGHSLEVAVAAQRIGESVTNDRRLLGHTYLAALLHAAGTLIVPSVESSPTSGDVSRLHRRAAARSCDPDSGVYLTALWGLPQETVRTIAGFRHPGESDDTDFSPLTAVHVAHVCIDARGASGRDVERGELDVDYLRRINRVDQLDVWRKLCQTAKTCEVVT